MTRFFIASWGSWPLRFSGTLPWNVAEKEKGVLGNDSLDRFCLLCVGIVLPHGDSECAFFTSALTDTQIPGLGLHSYIHSCPENW